MPTSHREYILRRAESVGPRDTNREPDNTEEEVDSIDADRDAEHSRVPLRWQIVDGNGNDEDSFGDGPYEGTPFDVVVANSSREVHLPDCQL